LQELALALSLKCLSFDFVGTSVDESSDEFGTVQVSVFSLFKSFNFREVSHKFFFFFVGSSTIL